ncbi:MAG: hypothetical protein CVV30_04365 [Methanomicrobiales archaeon HGW-Methanomicrobiales-1]|jgi:cell division septation protein DedD|nr:MAG: hypothetical protein CVV30_04365 [Methanomicrobiales archaeon HGW-Methanomicrobiales-1]
MEKIQIQFKESDYKIYYDYCLRYYQIHDAMRIQSLHAFLDLFEKGIIPLEEQDINKVRQLLLLKCNDLKKEDNGTREKGDTTMLLQLRVCSDLLLFIEDLEKIYRLIQKQGISANYLMILGTFSRVIEENRSSHPVSRYELKSEVIETLAQPLAGIIQMRLGTDRNWRSVLRELTFIAARFNQLYPEPKFDLDILQLVGPAVVSHFNKDVDFREIRSVLPSYYEDSELEEFEALLNQTPDILKNDQTKEINWDAIFEPLKVIADAVAVQRDHWAERNAKLSDQYSLVLPVGTTSSNNGIYPAGVPSPSYPDEPRANRFKIFDIGVSPEFSHQAESPVTVSTVSDTPLKKPEIVQFAPVFIGVAIIILFIFGTMFVSGDWDLFGAGNTTNSTTVIDKNITTAKPAATTAPKATTVKPAATAVPKATTAKPTATAVPKATTAKPTATPTPKSYSSADIGNHLMEIAFGPDNSKIQKPTKDRVAISISGTYNEDDIVLVNNLISQFNTYSSTTKLSENIDLSGASDIWLNFLPGNALTQIKDEEITYSYKNMQTGDYYFLRTDDKTYVNSDLKGAERSRWILRAVLNNLGFYGETAKYPGSLFYTGTVTATQLDDIDLKALQLMYGKKVTNGMTKSTVKTLF